LGFSRTLKLKSEIQVSGLFNTKTKTSEEIMKNDKSKNRRVAVQFTATNLKTKLTAFGKTFREYAKAIFPVLALFGLCFFFNQTAHAQGPIFTGDAGNLSNIIREGLKLMSIVLFCLGAVGIAWAIYNKMTGKEYGSQAFGSILAFAFGTVVAVFWQIAQGRAVSVDTNF